MYHFFLNVEKQMLQSTKEENRIIFYYISYLGNILILYLRINFCFHRGI